MYNEALKSEFMQETTDNISVARSYSKLFSATEPYEEKWGADLCTRNADELQIMVNEMLGTRASSIRVRLIWLKTYVKWCVDNGVPGACDGMLQIRDAGVDRIREQMVSSPFHLQIYLDSVFDPESEQTTDNIYRCFFWLAYGGMEEEEIFEVKASEIDFENMVVRHNNLNYPIYRESIRAFKNCAYLTEFNYKNPAYVNKESVPRDRVPGDTLIRGIRNIPTPKSFKVTLSRKSKAGIESGATTIKLSYQRAWLSGLFYRMSEMERAGLPVDFTDAAIRFTASKEYKLDSGRNLIGAKVRYISKGYAEDYQRWKLAYS